MVLTTVVLAFGFMSLWNAYPAAWCRILDIVVVFAAEDAVLFMICRQLYHRDVIDLAKCNLTLHGMLWCYLICYVVLVVAVLFSAAVSTWFIIGAIVWALLLLFIGIDILAMTHFIIFAD